MDTHTRPATCGSRRGFSLVELVTAIVILGLVAGIGFAIYRAVVIRSQDESASLTLHGVHRRSNVGEKSAQSPVYEAARVERMILTEMPAGWQVRPDASTSLPRYVEDTQQVAYGISADGLDLATATLSESGRCIFGYSKFGQVATTEKTDFGAGPDCSGERALDERELDSLTAPSLRIASDYTTDRQIGLEWTASSSARVVGYDVYATDATRTDERIGRLTADRCTELCVVAAPVDAPDAEATYTVEAVLVSGTQTDRSNDATGRSWPAITVEAFVTAPDEVRLTWDAVGGSNVSGYEVYITWTDSSGNDQERVDGPVDASSCGTSCEHVAGGLEPDTDYTFQVAAVLADDAESLQPVS